MKFPTIILNFMDIYLYFPIITTNFPYIILSYSVFKLFSYPRIEYSSISILSFCVPFSTSLRDYSVNKIPYKGNEAVATMLQMMSIRKPYYEQSNTVG